MEQYKTCSKCKQSLLITNFCKQSKSKDGLQSQCKPCKAAGNRITMSKWRQANPELHRDRNKSYQQKNPIKSKLLRKQRHDRNRDADNAYSRNYYKKNPYRIRELASIRKRKVSIAGIFLVTDKELSRLYNSKCQICGSCELIEIDLIIPIARGGRHSIGNLMSLCRSCNRSKSDKLHIEFIFIRREFEKLATNMVN